MRALVPRASFALASLLLAFAAIEPAAVGGPADPAPPASAAAPRAEIVPPRPLGPLHADYPPSAEGDARVVLVITVNADGAVRTARVDSGDEPFASAAFAAAAAFRFAPATRDGKPIAAAIRVEIRFTAPSPEPRAPASAEAAKPSPGAGGPGPAPRASGLEATSPGAQADAASQPIDVTVRGEMLAPGVMSLSNAEVRLLPGAFGDPFRAIEMFPGVTPLASGFPYFYVRGAPPGNVGYFIDGIRVPLLYHLGLGPSVVHPAIIDRVDLYSGGYPAGYGRYAGGIVTGETKPPLDRWHGEGVLRLVDAGALVEGPFADGRGAALVAGRYSYTGALLSLIQSQVRLDYWDYQARVSFDVTPKDTLTLFAFGSHDYFGNRTDTTDEQGNTTSKIQTFFNTTFHRLDLRYTHRLGPESSVRQAITLGFDQTELQQGSFTRDFMVASRTDIVHRIGEGSLLKAGFDATIDRTESDLSKGPDPGGLNNLLNKCQDDLAAGAYAEVVFQVTPRLEVTPGVRVDFYGEKVCDKKRSSALGVDPRLSARLSVTPSLRLIEAIGVASQTPSFILPGPGFRLDLKGGLQRSWQASAGVEADLPLDISAKLVLFQSALFNVTDGLGTNFTQGDTSGGSSDAFDVASLGHTLGLELSVHRRLTHRLGGFLSYTLSRSTRALGRTSLPTSFDRTHDVNAALSYDFTHGYRAGGRVSFYTGGPLIGFDSASMSIFVKERLPPFFRLDIRLEKRWNIGQRGFLSVVLEVLNTTLTKEALAINCADDGSCKSTTIGPLTLPSLGLEGGF